MINTFTLKIVTAVKFLTNVKVINNPVEMKRSFLFKKGLTEAEISEAFRRTGSAMSELPHRMIHMNTHQSLSSKLRDILNILLLIGGFSYSLRYLWKVWKIYHNFSISQYFFRNFYRSILVSRNKRSLHKKHW